MTSGLLWRSIVAFLALPTVVAFVIPWLFFSLDGRFDPSALLIAVIGIGLLLWCVREFYVAGRGTLAPWAPPTHLVTSGLYRFSRNPMYLAVLTILFAWAVGFRSIGLSVYAASMAIAFHLRVVFFEEPWLARTFGDDWLAYRDRVPRWIGRASMAAADNG